MTRNLLILGVCFLLFGCLENAKIIPGDYETSILPTPKFLQNKGDALLIYPSSELYSSNDTLNELLGLFAEELQALTTYRLEIAKKLSYTADIIFEIDKNLDLEEYHINVDQTVRAKGGSYQALSMAKTSLLQLVERHVEGLAFPRVNIQDKPDASYRGLMIDLARKWHDFETVKRMVDLAAYYKVNFLHLHFTDDQSFTFPSQAYPKLAMQGRHYSLEQLKELEAYSQLRGVTIVPELEVPGHASQFVKKYPEIFAIEDTQINSRIINMGNPKVYEAVNTLIGEMITVFPSSPYFHAGGDEAYFAKVIEDAKVRDYMNKNSLGTDVHELYRHFLIQVNDMVKSYGKTLCIWEGFTPEGKIEIPKDIVVFEFETNRYLPDQLVGDGYTVVNTSWQPLYVVNKRKWSPEKIYGWNMWRWENWWDQAPSIVPIQIEKSSLIIGAQMCSWEQAGEIEIPSLRRRVPAFVERVWNVEEKLSFGEWEKGLNRIDNKLSILLKDDRQDEDIIFPE